MISLVLLSLAAQAADLPAAFEDAAVREGVPKELLLALSWEATRWDVDAHSAWGGAGLFDLREVGDGPRIEQVAQVSGISPDALLSDPIAQVDGVAALLAWRGARLDGGTPAAADLLGWWDAVVAFSGRQDPVGQAMFASYIYETMNFGIAADPDTGLVLHPHPVDHWDRSPAPPPTTCDYGGCAQFVPAYAGNYSDYSRTPDDISMVIIHTVQGSYDGCISWFQNPSAQVSAHYVVRSSDGAVTQMVQEQDVAWHAGNWSYNETTVGIEHEGYIDAPETWYTDGMYAGSAALTADICARNNIPISRSYIIGHVEIPGTTHTDPGDGWDWDYYMSLVEDGGGVVVGNLTGVVADGDIYDGEPLIGATVWIEQTGEDGVTDGDGYYRFSDLPLSSYTVHACMDGFAEGTCEKDIGGGDNWCSIALQPGDGSCTLDGGEDSGTADTGEVVDSGEPDSGAIDTGTLSPPRMGRPPGTLVNPTALGGCGCAAAGGASGAVWLLGLVGLVSRRRLSR